MVYGPDGTGLELEPEPQLCKTFSTMTQLMIPMVKGPLLYNIRRNRMKYTVLFPVFRIRMDPGFFADSDPGFKSPDPSINKLIGSK